MSQIGRPISDIANVGWTPTPVYAQIDEPFPNDANYVISSLLPGTSVFEVLLGELANPVSGIITLSVRLEKTDMGNLPVSIKLLQGNNTLIASRSVLSPAFLFTTYHFDLTNAEVTTITNFADLRLRVSVSLYGGSSSSSSSGSNQSETSGGSTGSSTTSGQSGTSGGSSGSDASGSSGTSEGSSGSGQSGASGASSGSAVSAQSGSSSSESSRITVGCCPNITIPPTLHVTITNNAGCACLAGSFALTWRGDSVWSWQGTSCAGIVGIDLRCVVDAPENSFAIYIFCNGWHIGLGITSTFECDPPVINFGAISIGSMGGCCNGSVNVTVTE